MSARRAVSRPEPGLDVSPDIQRLREEIGTVQSLSPASPHHFWPPRSRDIDPAITDYAKDSVGSSTLRHGYGSVRAHPPPISL